MRHVRIWTVGFGTVGQWLLRAPDDHRARFADGYALSWWPTALDGMRATEADVLVEVSESPAADGEPGLSHLEEALGRGIAAVTSNKWPVALHGVRLSELARTRSTVLRAESTVMSGTPVMGTLRDGIAGASPAALRGVLNATANFIASEMSHGKPYADAVAEAQRRGLAERDPAADVEGHDSVAKTMILAALVFGRQLRVGDVGRRGIASVGEDALSRAASEGLTIREVSTLERHDGETFTARVEPVGLQPEDRLAGVEGIDNAVICEVEPLGEIMITGPGAGLGLAGQGALSDLINVASSHSS